MMRQVMKTKNNSLTIIYREVNQAMKNAAFNYKITAYQRKRRVSNLKSVHLQQFKSSKLILNAFRLFIRVVQFAGPLSSDMGAV